MPSTAAFSPSSCADTARAGDLALEIAHEFCRVRVKCGPGSFTWLAEPLREGRRPRPMGPHLYDGTTGISLFLAATAAFLSSSQAATDSTLQPIRETALGGLKPLRVKLLELARNPAESLRIALGVGGLNGAGSFVYALARAGHLLQDRSLRDDALLIARAFLTPERIEEDTYLDVMSGTAGAVLSLLAVHGSLESEDQPSGAAEQILDVARSAGRHLLARQNDAGGWPGIDRPALTGFAHGAAGIAHALLTLAERVDGAERDELREAALRAFAFERSLFVPEAQTWMDPRRNRPLEQTAWCHGAPGMLLSRLAATRYLDEPLVRRDLEQALELTCRLGEKEVDHLCCGNAGQVEVLRWAGAKLDNDSYRELADELICSVEARGIRFSLEDDDSTHHSLFLGRAGWGWCLLQTAAEGRLPSVLLMEH